MKKIDYYAVQHPWRMPKWLGATLGAIFGFILIVSGVAIVKLTRSPAPVAALVAAPSTSAAPAVATTVAAPAAQPTAVAPVAAPAPVAQADAAPVVNAKHHGKHHASSKHAAVASRASKHAGIKGGTLVANANGKHDHKLKDKDALDKLLGL